MPYWHSLRPQQWIKNAFVWAGFLFGRQWNDITPAAHAAIAFAAFCLLSSAVYVGNDWVDRESDRAHPVKRARPIGVGIPPSPWLLMCGLMLTLLLGFGKRRAELDAVAPDVARSVLAAYSPGL